jgi:hypothetical protein
MVHGKVFYLVALFGMQELAASCGVDASAINIAPVKRWEVCTPYVNKNAM